MYVYNWITLLCTWNIVSQLCFNKICLLNKQTKRISPDRSPLWTVGVGWPWQVLSWTMSHHQYVVRVLVDLWEFSCWTEILWRGQVLLRELKELLKGIKDWDLLGHAWVWWVMMCCVCMWELDCEESWAPKNWHFWTVVLEKTLESPLDCKEIPPVHSEGDQPWDFFGRNDAELTHWKRLWCWEGLGAGGEGDDRGWDGWMASLTQRTWVWVNSGSWWWTGRPGALRFMGSQRVGHNWVTDLIWFKSSTFCFSILSDCSS